MAKFSKLSSAEMMALVRTIGSKERDIKLRAADDLAESFLPFHLRLLLSSRMVRSLIKYIYSKKLPGGIPYIVAKSRAIDDMLESSLADGDIKQLIFLGAGYDSRAYRFKHLLLKTRTYEIDHPEITSRKRAHVEQLGLARGDVHYCAADFSAGKDAFGLDWLSAQGVQRSASTVFIMDGVSYFLTPDAFRRVVEVMAEFPPGTQVVFDYAYAEILEGKTYRGSEAFKASLAKMGEPVTGGIAESRIAEYLQEFGFEVVSLLRPLDIETDYLTSSNGTSMAPYGFLDIVRARKSAE